MKKKQADPGLQYLIDIHFERITGVNGMIDRWRKVFGELKAKQLIAKWERLEGASPEFYKFKNSDPEISKSICERFDSVIIRKACNYVYSKKEYFGKTILEVGCESGYMTGFLARTFPDARIVSIDRCEAALQIAKQRTDKLNITNVEFRNCSLHDIKEEFDTVFCMRVIQENIRDSVSPHLSESIIYQAEKYAEMTHDFLADLKLCLKEDGYLCMFERVDHDPLQLGMMTELCRIGCAPLLETYEEITCEEALTENLFTEIVCQNSTYCEPQTVLEKWSNILDKEQSDENVSLRWNALNLLRKKAGKLVTGCRMLDKDGEAIGRIALFEDANDSSILYYLMPPGYKYKAFAAVEKHPESEKEKITEEIEEISIGYIREGYDTQIIYADEEYLEGNIENE